MTSTFTYDIQGQHFLITDTHEMKTVESAEYNYIFKKSTGTFLRWGQTHQDDPQICPIGPEILDIEISINGCQNKCAWCYKGNTDGPPTNMDFDMYRTILGKIPKTLTQVALGITSVQTNPDFQKMLSYTRSCGFIPNFTTSGIDLTESFAKEIQPYVGAIAVSAYQTDKNVCYNTIKMLTDLGYKQINIHLLVSRQTMSFVWEVLKDIKEDPRLAKMYAVIFLAVKPKGRAVQFTSATGEEYDLLVQHCISNNIIFGLDSCSAPKIDDSIRALDVSQKDKNLMLACSERCESTLFSCYINVYGVAWACSFAENEQPICVDVLGCKDFIKDVWYSEPISNFREGLLSKNRNCPIFSL
jgi:hypothetical protein